MKKAALFTIVFLGIFTPVTVNAASKVNVDISNNGSGSKNSVNVKTNTSVNSTNESNSKTDIRIESNGEVKEYHSDDGGDVELKSSDGNSSVKINAPQTTTKPISTTAPTNSSVKVNVHSDGESIKVAPSAPPTPTVPPTPNSEVLGDKTKNVEFKLAEFIKELLSSIRIKF